MLTALWGKSSGYQIPLPGSAAWLGDQVGDTGKFPFSATQLASGPPRDN